MSSSAAENAIHNGIIHSFKNADTNGNGALTIDEMTSLLSALNPKLDAGKCKVLFDAADTDNNGQVNYTEFVNWLNRTSDDQGLMDEDIHTFVLRFDKPLNVFESTRSGHVIGKISPGDRVVSGGRVEVVDGYAMLPIMDPMVGAVEANRLLHEYVSHGEVQWKLHDSDLKGFQIHNQSAKPRDDDPDFPDFVNSHGTNLVAPATLGPVMAGVCQAPHMVKLFEDIRPDAIRQGHLGDCWLLAAISNLCEFPDLVQACFPGQTELSLRGNYRVRLFDPVDNMSEHIVEVTDSIPYYEGDGVICQPVYSKPMGNECFVQILEKAAAKFMHSGRGGGEATGWHAIESGTTLFGFALLTGAPAMFVFKRKSRGQWRRIKIQAFSCKTSYTYSDDDTISNAKVWESLTELDSQGALISCSFHDGKKEGRHANGLISGHAFTVLSCLGGHAMCRNPWGGSMKWKGNCSDDSGFWDTKAGKKVAQDIGYTPGKANGTFVMPSADFMKNWDTVYVAQCGIPRRQDY